MASGLTLEEEIRDLRLQLAFSNYVLRKVLWAQCRTAAVTGDIGASLKIDEFKSALLRDLTDKSDQTGLNTAVRDLTNMFFAAFEEGHNEMDEIHRINPNLESPTAAGTVRGNGRSRRSRM